MSEFKKEKCEACEENKPSRRITILLTDSGAGGFQEVLSTTELCEACAAAAQRIDWEEMYTEVILGGE